MESYFKNFLKFNALGYPPLGGANLRTDVSRSVGHTQQLKKFSFHYNLTDKFERGNWGYNLGIV